MSMRTWTGAALLLLSTGLLAGWGDSVAWERNPAAPGLPLRAIATCEEAGLGTPPAGWKPDATSVGGFGLIGPGRDFRSEGLRELKNGQYLTKLPAIAKGSAPVRVTVPPRLSRRVGLDFGDFWTEERVRDANQEVLFRPCKGRRRTGWPGGLILKDRRPIRLTVRIAGDDRLHTLSVGRR